MYRFIELLNFRKIVSQSFIFKNFLNLRVRQLPPPSLAWFGPKLYRFSFLYYQPFHQVPKKLSRNCALNRIQNKSSTYIQHMYMNIVDSGSKSHEMRIIISAHPPLGHFLENRTWLNITSSRNLQNS